MQNPSFPGRPFGGAVHILILSLVLLFASCGTLFCQSDPAAGPFRTQAIELEAGWNAVYLEIEPLESDPTALFADTPLEIVAAYFRPVSSAEFIDSPNELISRRENWSVWYAPDREDTLLSNLYSILGHRSYLIYVEEAFTLSITGIPSLGAAKWHPNAYNLVGFQIESSEQPTMENFFSGSDAQSDLKVYRMIDGRWALVSDPASTLVEPGAAYWAYSEGASQFTGPLEVSVARSTVSGLVFTEESSSSQIVIKNVSTYPQNLSFELSPGNAGLLPLNYVVTVINPGESALEKTSLPLPQTMELGTLEPGQAFALDVEVDQSEVTEPLLSALFTITSDAGVRRQIPIVSIRRDLAE